ncbi:unnamed protein product [Fusarium fujikuroi]|uniref:Uncharacterized protein n=1 Tax=Fusarium fujikuroi TaxID=5127 RepID=A0A9Q9R9X0_FUSFU|nr:unnamed protein product [Fusarium fujikuroi]
MKFASVSAHEAERMRKGAPEECGQDAKHLGVDGQPQHQIGWLPGDQECSDFRLSTEFIQHDGFSNDRLGMRTAAEGYRFLIDDRARVLKPLVIDGVQTYTEAIMKYPVFVFLFAAVGVTAQAANCSESDACGDNERCLCGTHKEIANCYVNCDKDSRAKPAEQAVEKYCSVLRKHSKPLYK